MDDSTKSKAIKEDFNGNFFMLLGEKPWQQLPFAIPELLAMSKYDDTPVDFVRFARNIIIHAGQHWKHHLKHYGRVLSSTDVLNEILKYVPHFIIFINWHAKLHMPELPFTQAFPESCAKAYGQQIEMARKEISNPKALYAQLCQGSRDSEEAVTKPNTQKMLEDAFKRSQQEIAKILRKTDPEFKGMKEDLKSLENKKKRLEKSVQVKTNLGKSQTDIDRAKTELASVERQLELLLEFKWMIDYRDAVKDFGKSRARKLLNNQTKIA